jgi:hypothetical protein
MKRIDPSSYSGLMIIATAALGELGMPGSRIALTGSNRFLRLAKSNVLVTTDLLQRSVLKFR